MCGECLGPIHMQKIWVAKNSSL